MDLADAGRIFDDVEPRGATLNQLPYDGLEDLPPLKF